MEGDPRALTLINSASARGRSGGSVARARHTTVTRAGRSAFALYARRAISATRVPAVRPEMAAHPSRRHAVVRPRRIPYCGPDLAQSGRRSGVPVYRTPPQVLASPTNGPGHRAVASRRDATTSRLLNLWSRMSKRITWRLGRSVASARSLISRGVARTRLRKSGSVRVRSRLPPAAASARYLEFVA